MTKMKLVEAEAGRKTADELVTRMQADFEGYRRTTTEKRQKLVAEAQKVLDVYKELLMAVGEGAEPPANIPVADFLTWLLGELATLGVHMAMGRDYTSMESLWAYAKALQDASCDQFRKVEEREVKSYWTLSDEANSAAVHFFEAF